MGTQKNSKKKKTPNTRTGNKGEWSEVYVFFKLLGTPELIQCDKYLHVNGGKVAFDQIFRKPNKKSDPLCYTYDVTQKQWSVSSGKQERAISTELCKAHAEDLLKLICETDWSGTHEFPEIFSFLKDYLLADSIKANSKEKKDIKLRILEKMSGSHMLCGFSIKSLIGQDPTLLNPARTTCFTYKILGITEAAAEAIQGYSVESYEYKEVPDGWISTIVHQIQASGGRLLFHSLNETFRRNLELIDGKMAEIISSYVLAAYSESPRTTKKRNFSLNIPDVTSRVSALDPADFRGLNKELLYAHKIKEFLKAVALGMTPGKPWQGKEDANGGYIIVQADGTLVTFLIYDREALLDYLYENTKLEHPSFSKLNRKPKKKAWPTPVGRIYKKDDALFISLPLQIRFTL